MASARPVDFAGEPSYSCPMQPLGPDEVQVFPFSIGDDSPVCLRAAGDWLSEEERERAGRFKFAIHRDRYVRGRGRMREILASYLAMEPGDLRLETAETGKPYLGCETLHFNLSHSEDLAVLAVSRLPSIGVDVECFHRDVDVDGLGRRCFRPSELQRLQALEGEDKRRAFFWTWTAKEARMKATGEGFRLEPKRIEIAFAGEHPRDCLEPRLPSAFVCGVDLPGGGAACTVAALTPFRVQFGELPALVETR